MNNRELDYCLRRAREEVRKADSTDVPAAASVHRSLAMRYSARALLLGAGNRGKLTHRFGTRGANHAVCVTEPIEQSRCSCDHLRRAKRLGGACANRCITVLQSLQKIRSRQSLGQGLKLFDAFSSARGITGR